MKKCFLLLISIFGLVTCNLAQQNLVPNYSFENYTICPSGAGAIYNAESWFQPNIAGNSSDAYNVCYNLTNPIMGVPYNPSEFQLPRTGDGYSGINFFHDTTSIWPDLDREYIEVGLNDTLEIGKKYCVRFFTVKGNWSMWAVKNIQAVFTNDSLFYNDANYGFISGQNIILESDTIVRDTLLWQPIQTTYTANGGEEFLTIGNFSPGSLTIHDLVLPYNSNPNTLGYYLIDDVSVYELPDYFAGIDTTICPWDSIIIGPQNVRADVQYSWSPVEGLSNPNIANPLASPLVNTNYILTITDTCQWACNSILKDTINIAVGGCLGVAEIENKIKSRLVPNPASTFCVYEAELEINQSGKIEIYDINGKLIESFGLKEGENRLEIVLTSYQNGIYIFKIIVDEVLIETKRIVITK